MSTNTRMQFTVKSDYTVAGNQTICLDRILGPGGQRLVLDTLKSLGSRQQLLPGETEGTLNWKQIKEENSGTPVSHYCLTLPQDVLPQISGLQQVDVHMRIRGAITEVTHEARYSHTQTQTDMQHTVKATPEQQQEVQKVVNRSINCLLAYGMANRLQNGVKEHLKQKLSVRAEQRIEERLQMRVSNRVNIQMYASLRQ